MASDLGGHEDRDSGSASSSLASELRRIIMELDAERYPEDHSAQTSEEVDDEVQDEIPGLSAVIHSLKRNMEDATAETAVAIRLLHELVHLRHTDLHNHLIRMEQNLQDEINLMERRIRGDIAALRVELGVRTLTDRDDRPGDASSASEQGDRDS